MRDRAARTATLRFRVTDEPQNHQFRFDLVSQDDRALCYDGDEWPDNPHAATDGTIELMTSQGVLRAKNVSEMDFGMMCARSADPDCGTRRLEAHQSLVARLDYAVYGDPNSLAQDTAKSVLTNPGFPHVRLCQDKISVGASGK